MNQNAESRRSLSFADLFHISESAEIWRQATYSHELVDAITKRRHTVYVICNPDLDEGWHKGQENVFAATNALASGPTHVKMDYRIVPHAVFTDPQLAGVGRTEGGARDSGIRVQSTTVPLSLVAKAGLTKDTRGAIKVIFEERSRRILRVHMLAPQASDILHEGVMIVKEKMTVEDVLDTLHIFPSLSYAFKKAAHAPELVPNKIN